MRSPRSRCTGASFMSVLFRVPIEGIENKSFKYFGDEAKKTNGLATLDVRFTTFFKDW